MMSLCLIVFNDSTEFMIHIFILRNKLTTFLLLSTEHHVYERKREKDTRRSTWWTMCWSRNSSNDKVEGTNKFDSEISSDKVMWMKWENVINEKKARTRSVRVVFIRTVEFDRKNAHRNMAQAIDTSLY